MQKYNLTAECAFGFIFFFKRVFYDKIMATKSVEVK